MQRKDVLIYYNNKVVKIINTDFKLNYIEFKDNNIFFATDDGIYIFVDNKLYQPSYLLPTKGSVISKIYVDSNNDTWFVSRGNGLFLLNSKSILTHFNLENNLPSNIINDICEVKNKGFLLSTSKGLYYGFRHYNDSSFLSWKMIYPKNVFTTNVCLGKIYIATKNGLVIIDNNVTNEKDNLFFNIASILVNGKIQDISKIKQLDYYENNIEFNFDLLLFSSSAPNIKYILEGPEEKLGIVKNQSINFQKLPPGSYKLTVEPDTDDGKNYKKTIKFFIKPAFWQTTLFLILSCFSLVVFIIIFSRLLVRYYKTKEFKKAEFEKIIAEHKLIALKAQINPHFMSNCISAIQYLILKNKVDEANEYLAKFSFLVRQVLNYSGKPLIKLKEEIELINLYMELEKLRFDKIKIEITVDSTIDVNSIYLPPLILQPVFENAIWHGLLPLKNKRVPLLFIDIKKINNSLKISIEDNGVGRIGKVSEIGNSNKSKGVEITSQRIENLKYLCLDYNSGIKYVDLVDENNEAIGTKVIITLPLNLNKDV